MRCQRAGRQCIGRGAGMTGNDAGAVPHKINRNSNRNKSRRLWRQQRSSSFQSIEPERAPIPRHDHDIVTPPDGNPTRTGGPLAASEDCSLPYASLPSVSCNRSPRNIDREGQTPADLPSIYSTTPYNAIVQNGENRTNSPLSQNGDTFRPQISPTSTFPISPSSGPVASGAEYPLPMLEVKQLVNMYVTYHSH